ncbi:hypothetical protein ACP6EW_09285 [Hafnia paralvei]|uniref:hypothetical protein n=1 Tax=Hafnia paralvei TaxID=546367 RepID=UPI003CF7776D
MIDKNRVKVDKFLRGIPIVGQLYRITNSYVFEGAPEGHSQIAPFAMWKERLFKNVLVSLIIAVIIIFCIGCDFSKWAVIPPSIILSVFPSILGFGIGAYALLFIMPNDFLKDLICRAKNRGFGPEMIIVDMSYPLVVFIEVIAIGGISSLFKNSFIWNSVSLFFLLYGLCMLVELMMFLFNSSFIIHKIRRNKSALFYKDKK